MRPYRGIDASERLAHRKSRFIEAGLDLLSTPPGEPTVRLRFSRRFTVDETARYASTISTLRTASARRVRPSLLGSFGNRRGALAASGAVAFVSSGTGVEPDRAPDAREPARVRVERPGPAGDVRAGRRSRAIRPDLSSGQAYGQLVLNLGKAAAPA